MVPEERIRELMLLAIEESTRSVPEDRGVHPKVGAVLAASDGSVIAQAHRGQEGHGDHAEFLVLKKALEAGRNVQGGMLFVTLEPCTSRGPEKTPCTERILQSGISKVYIGILDPNTQICGRGETFLRYRLDVERFPLELVKRIEQINSAFIDLHRSEHLPKSSLYVTTQISALICQFLNRAGISVDEDEFPTDWDITVEDLFHYCSSSQSVSAEELARLLMQARGYSFDKKYADYSYDKDVRGLGDYWHNEIRSIFRKLRAADYPSRRILNVGIGNGLEGREIFEDCQHLTVVDIAPKSLERARTALPRTTSVLSEAEDLHDIKTASQDIYVSSGYSLDSGNPYILWWGNSGVA